MFIKAARAQGFPTFQIAQVRHYAAELRAGAFADVTDHYQEVCGRPPEDFATQARRYVNEPGLINRGLTVGSRAGAVQLALRMAFTRAIDLDQWERSRDYPIISDAILAHDNPDWAAAAAQRELLLLPDTARSTDMLRPEPAHSQRPGAGQVRRPARI